MSTFYDMFRHKPAGESVVRVCRGTACHVSGAPRVEDALRRHLHIAEGDDTDAERKFTVEPVADRTGAAQRGGSLRPKSDLSFDRFPAAGYPPAADLAWMV